MMTVLFGYINRWSLKLSVFALGFLLSLGAAAPAGAQALPLPINVRQFKNSLNSISRNIIESISELPTLLAALSYLGGATMGTLGLLKIKDHVEQPSQTPLKEGAIRLATGGALLSLPIIFEAMTTGIGSGNAPFQVDLPSLRFFNFGNNNTNG